MEDLLELESRRRLFEFIEAYPGLHLRELERQVGMDVRALKHHLDFLERHEAVTALREEGYLRYYPRDRKRGTFRERIGAPEKRVVALLRQRVALQVVLLLAEHGELRTEDIQTATHVAPSTLSYYLAKLRRLGLVAYRQEARERIHRLQEPAGVVQLLVRYPPTPDLMDAFLDLWSRVGL